MLRWPKWSFELNAEVLKFTKKHWKVLVREIFADTKNMHSLLCAQSKGLKKV